MAIANNMIQDLANAVTAQPVANTPVAGDEWKTDPYQIQTETYIKQYPELFKSLVDSGAKADDITAVLQQIISRQPLSKDVLDFKAGTSPFTSYVDLVSSSYGTNVPKDQAWNLIGKGIDTPGEVGSYELSTRLGKSADESYELAQDYNNHPGILRIGDHSYSVSNADPVLGTQAASGVASLNPNTQDISESIQDTRAKLQKENLQNQLDGYFKQIGLTQTLETVDQVKKILIDSYNYYGKELPSDEQLTKEAEANVGGSVNKIPTPTLEMADKLYAQGVTDLSQISKNDQGQFVANGKPIDFSVTASDPSGGHSQFSLDTNENGQVYIKPQWVPPPPKKRGGLGGLVDRAFGGINDLLGDFALPVMAIAAAYTMNPELFAAAGTEAAATDYLGSMALGSAETGAVGTGATGFGINAGASGLGSLAIPAAVDLGATSIISNAGATGATGASIDSLEASNFLTQIYDDGSKLIFDQATGMPVSGTDIFGSTFTPAGYADGAALGGAAEVNFGGSLANPTDVQNLLNYNSDLALNNYNIQTFDDGSKMYTDPTTDKVVGGVDATGTEYTVENGVGQYIGGEGLGGNPQTNFGGNLADPTDVQNLLDYNATLNDPSLSLKDAKNAIKVADTVNKILTGGAGIGAVAGVGSLLNSSNSSVPTVGYQGGIGPGGLVATRTANIAPEGRIPGSAGGFQWVSPVKYTPVTTDELDQSEETDVVEAAEGGLMSLYEQNTPVLMYAGGGQLPTQSSSMASTKGLSVEDANKAVYLIGQGYSLSDAIDLIKGGVDTQKMAIGGISDLGSYTHAVGGRMLKGPGDGMSDDIPATIAGKRPARLATDEFVIPADVVSHLGNGSSDAGAKVLYDMMAKVRKARTGNAKQGKQINPNKFIPKG